MYTYQYINKLEQLGWVSYTLILTDLDEIGPDVRIEKTFRSDISSSELQDVAIAEIERVVVEAGL